MKPGPKKSQITKQQTPIFFQQQKKARGGGAVSMSYCPPEIVTNVLSWLPVKPLLLFTCVSKSWYALIHDPNFIKLHLNNSILTNSHHHLIVVSSDSIYSLNLDSLHNLLKLNSPLKSHEFYTQIGGSSNGLLCLYNYNEVIVLWNPYTRTHHKLPPFQLPEPQYLGCSHDILYGFGYDHLNDDYKVVRIKQSCDDRSHDLLLSQVTYYSLKSNSWKMVSFFPLYLCGDRASGVFANGALHCVVSETFESDKSNLIAAFDIGTGEYRLVPQPDYDYLDTNFCMDVGVLAGCFCVITNVYSRYVDIWVMKEYGIKESWTKLISVSQPNDVRSLQFASPIAYSKSGEQVLLWKNNEQFIWYDLKRKNTENVTVGGLQTFSSSNVCVESLVMLPHGGGGGKNFPLVYKRKKGKKKNKQVPEKRY